MVFNLTGANPYLTFHCTNQGTVLIDLAVDDKEFQSVEEEVRHMNSSISLLLHTVSVLAVCVTDVEFCAHRCRAQFESTGTEETQVEFSVDTISSR